MKVRFVPLPKIIPVQHGFKQMFSWKNLTKDKGVWPLLAVDAFAFGLMTSYIVYACFRKDHRFFRSRPEQHEQMDLLHPWSLKLMTIKQKWEPRPDLNDVYLAMKTEERKRKRAESD